jgi:hypothetical protein
VYVVIVSPDSMETVYTENRLKKTKENRDSYATVMIQYHIFLNRSQDRNRGHHTIYNYNPNYSNHYDYLSFLKIYNFSTYITGRMKKQYPTDTFEQSG